MLINLDPYPLVNGRLILLKFLLNFAVKGILEFKHMAKHTLI
jgi:hypothetical protein